MSLDTLAKEFGFTGGHSIALAEACCLKKEQKLQDTESPLKVGILKIGMYAFRSSPLFSLLESSCP